MKIALICCLVIVDAFEYFASHVTAFSVTSCCCKMVTGCGITAGFTSRETSQNVVFTDHSVKMAQIVTPSGFATRDIFMDRSSGFVDAIVSSQNHEEHQLCKVHGLTRVHRMAKDTWRLVALWCSWLCLTTVKCDNHCMEEPSARLPCASKREQSINFQIVKRASDITLGKTGMEG